MYCTIPKLPPLSSTRISLGVIIGQVLVATVWPFWGVEFVHVLVADALTSAVLLVLQVDVSLCLIFTGDLFVDEFSSSSFCISGQYFWVSKTVMYCLPFWIRFIQCVYKFIETRNDSFQESSNHLINAAKYVSGMIVIVFSGVKSLSPEQTGFQQPQLEFFWIVSLIVKTAFCVLWDILMDWDLGSLTRNDFLLRPKSQLFFPRWVYYLVIFFNLAARCWWTLTLSMTTIPAVWDPLSAIIEIVRRSVWFIFRIEREYLKVQNKKSQSNTVVKGSQYVAKNMVNNSQNSLSIPNLNAKMPNNIKINEEDYDVKQTLLQK